MGKKSSGVGRDMAALGDFGAEVIASEHSLPLRLAKDVIGSGILIARSSELSGVVENQDAAVAEGDFLGVPDLALVEAILVGFGGIPGTVEPVEVGLVVGDPSLDGLPGRLDGLHGFDVEGSSPRATPAQEGGGWGRLVTPSLLPG